MQGITADGSGRKYPLAEFDKVMAIHLRAGISATKLILYRKCVRGNLAFLNFSSLSTGPPTVGFSHAAAKKQDAGADARYGRGRGAQGVRVNAAAPGP
jgi:NAD(P)-dependent dehydrogenase (short-subunit alcohol dehydrogenase family)